MYESFYGFSAKPFQLNPDPTFFYGSKEHTRAMSYLEYGLHKNEGFIVITGEIGAGKTTVLHNLLARIDPKEVVAVQLVSSQLNADDTLRMVAAAFGLRATDTSKSDILLSMEAFLLQLQVEGRRALLIVDEAQNLSLEAMEELRMLSNYQLNSQALLQSFLVGQPEFRGMLENPRMEQLRQRIIAACHISPMDAEEAREYVRHRLKRVGWTGKPHFEADAYAALFEVTGGVPRRINSVCDRLLLAGFIAQQHVFNADDVRKSALEIQEETGFKSGETAREIQEESGLTPDEPAVEEHVNGADGAKMLNDLALGVDDFQALKFDVDPDRVERLVATVSQLQVSDFEERLRRLERTSNSTLAVLRHLLNAIRTRDGHSGENR